MHGYNSYENGGYKPFHRNRGRGRFNSQQRHFHQKNSFLARMHNMSVMNSRVFDSYQSSSSLSSNFVCQLCNLEGHTALVCGLNRSERMRCHICGKTNHNTLYCFYNNNGPKFGGNASAPASDYHAVIPQLRIIMLRKV